MRFSSARRLALLAFLPALLVLAVIPGCADQGEGERCGAGPQGTIADQDVCASGLTCKAINGVPRCCSDNSSNPNCQVTPNGNAGASSSAGSAGDAGASSTAGADNGGGDVGGADSGGAPSEAAGAGGAPEAEAGAPAAAGTPEN